MTTYDLAIFDCDGVLIDSEGLSIAILAEHLNRAGVTMTVEECGRRFLGYPESYARRICIDEYGLGDVDSVLAAVREDLYRAFRTRLSAMAGIGDVLADWPRAKCVASNSTLERLEVSLGAVGLWESFAPHVYSGELMKRPKPAPDLLLHCAERLGVSPARAIMIDDNSHGIEAALAAGMLAIGFVDPNDPRPDREHVLTAAGADHVVCGCRQLQALLASLDATPAPGLVSQAQMGCSA